MIVLVSLLFFPLSLVYASNSYSLLGKLGHQIAIPEHVLTFALICLALLGFGYFYRKTIKRLDIPEIPDAKVTVRNIFESMGEFFYQQCIAIIGEKDGPRFFPLAFSLFLLILFCNLIGLVPGFNPPTEEMSTTFALGVFTFFLYNYLGVRAVGLVNYLKHFAGPLWYMAILILPLELISHLVRPLTLGLRLKGNMLGDHTLLAIVYDLAPWGLPIFPLLLGLFTCIIQAFVFTILTLVYISLVLANHEHGADKAFSHNR